MADYYFTTEELLNSIKRRASIPTSRSIISDEEILQFADEEMRINIVPLLLSTNEDFYLYREDVPIINGQTSYSIPYRAVASKIREIGYTSGSSDHYKPLHRISIDHINTQHQDSVDYFYMQGDRVILHSSGNIGGNLVFFYPIRPNRLVKSTYVSKVTQINDNGDDTTTLVLDVNAPNDHFTNATKFDFIKTNSNHGVLGYDATKLTYTPSGSGVKAEIVFNNTDLPSTLEIGDTVAVSSETNIVPCPTELQPVLAQTVAARVLESIGDTEGLQRADRKLAKMEQASYTLTENRVEGSPIKIKRRNGLLRRGGRRFYRRGL
jgi:hypothetical protein